MILVHKGDKSPLCLAFGQGLRPPIVLRIRFKFKIIKIKSVVKVESKEMSYC